MDENGRKLILYGASNLGKLALSYFGQDIVEFFCDSNLEKVGTEFEKKTIISIEKLVEIKDSFDIIITSSYYEEIAKELIMHGIIHFGCFEPKLIRNYGEWFYIKQKMDNCSALVNKKIAKKIEFFTPPPAQGRVFESSIVSPSKLKVRFIFCNGIQIWNSLESLYWAFAVDEKYDTAVIIGTDERYGTDAKQMVVNYFSEHNIVYMNEFLYSAENDKPDIVIYNHAYCKVPYSLSPNRMKLYTKYLVYIPWEIYILDQVLVNNRNSEDIENNAWKIILNNKKVHKNIANQKNAVILGNPKFDKIYKNLKNVKIPDKWKAKCQGRTVLLWNTTHIITSDGKWKYFSMEKWLSIFIDFFAMHNEFALIYRPHPNIFHDLVKLNIWAENDINKFREYCNSSHNIILDESDDYSLAFYLSDAMMSDASGMLLSYLPTEKPILYLESNLGTQLYDKELIRNYYKASGEQELMEFAELIHNGNDPLYTGRMETRKEYIPYFDGHVGERIKDYIFKSLFMEKEGISY